MRALLRNTSLPVTGPVNLALGGKMGFIIKSCDRKLFELLELPAELIDSKKIDLINRKIICDLENKSALISHPDHHSIYPDKQFSFYQCGRHFNVWQLIKRSDGPDRIEMHYNSDLDEEKNNSAFELIKAAFGIYRSELDFELPFVIEGKPKQSRIPRSTNDIIRKLNKYFEDISGLDTQLIPNFEEMTIQAIIAIILLPEELKSLEQHLKIYGWNELTPKASEVIG
jgi:hypothetical protein